MNSVLSGTIVQQYPRRTVRLPRSGVERNQRRGERSDPAFAAEGGKYAPQRGFRTRAPVDEVLERTNVPSSFDYSPQHTKVGLGNWM